MSITIGGSQFKSWKTCIKLLQNNRASKFYHWKMERKAGLLLSCLFFSSCSAAANSSVFVMRAGGEVGCCATSSAAVQMMVAISPPLNSNLREEKRVIRKHPPVYSSGRCWYRSASPLKSMSAAIGALFGTSFFHSCSLSCTPGRGRSITCLQRRRQQHLVQ